MFNEKLNYILTEFWKSIRNENWERADDLITLNPEFMALGLECAYKHLPDEYKFCIPVECYTHNGDSMPTVRKYVRCARKYAPIEKRIPDDMAALSEITVYRAGEESAERARYAISWTTDFEVAKWFYERATALGFPARHLYQAKIKPEKIIWFTDDRSEKEVMQYNAVKEIFEIDYDGKPI